MKFTCALPDQGATVIAFARNPFFGSLSITANGQLVYSRSAFNPASHFNFSLSKDYEFPLPGPTPGRVRITEERPRLFAGFRRRDYQVFLNGQKIADYIGSERCAIESRRSQQIAAQ